MAADGKPRIRAIPSPMETMEPCSVSRKPKRYRCSHSGNPAPPPRPSGTMTFCAREEFQFSQKGGVQHPGTKAYAQPRHEFPVLAEFRRNVLFDDFANCMDDRLALRLR